MRILHTSDWHLGHRLYDRDRTAEHTAALAWLLDTIAHEKVELLVVAGDVFDTMNPSNAARQLYYDFLGKLPATGCRAAIIVGGNHDSPSLLDAPLGLMRNQNLHVVGGKRAETDDQVFRLTLTGADAGAGEGREAVVVAAVPFLRERDLRYAIAGEAPEARKDRVRASILEHYERIGAAAERLRADPTTPILATGHLFAAGGTDADDKASHIYMADRNNIAAGQFPAAFDYVALGHIHQAQRVGGREAVRYSGSLIPLTFGEARRPQTVAVFDLVHAGQDVSVRQLTVPRFRQLHSMRGTAAAVTDQLTAFAAEQRLDGGAALTPWLEIRVETPHPLPTLRDELRTIVEPAPAAAGEAPVPPTAEILRTSTVRPAGQVSAAAAATVDLSELNPEDVFFRLCHGNDPAAEPRPDYDDLLASFRELRSWLADQDSPAE